METKNEKPRNKSKKQNTQKNKNLKSNQKPKPRENLGNRTLFDPNQKTIHSINKVSENNHTVNNQRTIHSIKKVQENNQRDDQNIMENNTSISTKPPHDSTEITKLKETYKSICELEASIKNQSFNDVQLDQRLVLAQFYNTLIGLDYKLAMKYDLNNRQWKNIVYSLIGMLRNNKEELDDFENLKWKNYFNSILQFYEGQLNELVAKSPSKPYWLKHLLNIGDLFRYQARYLTNTDDERNEFLMQANLCYLQSALINPQNGFCWNQLAIVSNIQGLFMQEIMYRLISLCVKQPFLDNREMILDSFQKGIDVKTSNKDSSLILNGIQSKTIFEFESLFLQIHHTLFSKISVDILETELTKVNKLLDNAYDDMINLSTENHLNWWLTLSMIFISNMYLTIHHPHFEKSAIEALTDHYVRLTHMILKWVLTKLILFEKVSHHPLTIFVHLMLNWILVCDIPLFYHEQYKLTWLKLSKLMKVLNMEEEYSTVDSLNLENLVGLQEDQLLRGFGPLNRQTPDISFEQVLRMSHFIRLAEDDSKNRFMRIYQLYTCIPTDCLPNQQIGTDESSKIAVIDFEDFELESNEVSKTEYDFEEFDESDSPGVVLDTIHQPIVKDEDTLRKVELIILDSDSEHELSPDLIALKSRREKLSKTVKEKSNKVVLIPGTTTIIIDTNCFLRDINRIKSLMISKTFHFVIPLVVVSELDGLCNNEGTLGENAIDCLTFIESNMNLNLFQVMTSKGNPMNSLTVRSETWDDQYESADDVILGIARMIESTCLVTNDVNLRLKARTVGVPVLPSVASLFQ
ncbi:hypothetical protein BC833DRAFT_591227 [Globomyces pollinis-pini]|nr:hypothetical protein BC833DRAFT_591227 [Globomyces pollinis-pini]